MARSTILDLLERERILEVVEPRGSLEIFKHRDRVVVTRARGHLSREMAQRWIAIIEPHFERGVHVDTFHDWENVTSYDSEARRALTAWVTRRYTHITSAMFLVSTQIVAMGVSAASLATALAGLRMTATTSGADFDRALTRAL